MVSDYPPDIDLRLYNPEFDIIEDNDDFALVDKPPHLMVHPNKPGNPPTLLDGLQEYFVFEMSCGGQISIITRLDRETSGLVLVAKHKEAAGMLGKAMEAKEFRKSYHAIVHGWPEDDEFALDEPLLRKGEVADTPIYVKQLVHPQGKAAKTEFAVEQRLSIPGAAGPLPFSLVRCTPVTGRMHQIRVHLAHAGFPIVGDKMYGPDETCYLDFIETGWTMDLERRLLMNRQALHASRLGWKNREWSCELPSDMLNFLRKSPEFIGCNR